MTCTKNCKNLQSSGRLMTNTRSLSVVKSVKAVNIFAIINAIYDTCTESNACLIEINKVVFI